MVGACYGKPLAAGVITHWDSPEFHHSRVRLGGTVLADPARRFGIRQWLRYGHIEERTMQEAYHPNVNEQNRKVNELPTRFIEGDVIARRDPWADQETSHWVVRDVRDPVTEADAGAKYRIEQINADRSMFISHGAIQMAAARNQIRWDSGDA
jgi:hypothetical protein